MPSVMDLVFLWLNKWLKICTI